MSNNMDEKENDKKKLKNISMQNRGKKAPTARHRNPGYPHRRDRHLVQMLSSVVVVPPRYRSMPIANPGPSRTSQHRMVPETPWREPEQIELRPQTSEWRQARSLVPVPTVDYRYGYNIIPGEAYGPVPLYVDRERPWVLRPMEIPAQRTVHFYREDVTDPRMHDFRVEVVPYQTQRHRPSQEPVPPGESPLPEEPLPQQEPAAHEEPQPPEPVPQPSADEGNTQSTDRPTTPPPVVRRRRRCRLLIIG